ncbi:cytochrome P450 [Thamnocephalis sphaerospora]|uniref:Cytochrome P450 n=1 Tax=Thamnocephalis sphaerospora TaxID=78915 RepID=A0A4P9XMY2_9FUNG|nr:cytochrome P450 [Thamnocephalis sphaerospora]|eukprot:RKP07284.1 cytochrome P450 [Thamnocephalis sphaerospora]
MSLVSLLSLETALALSGVYVLYSVIAGKLMSPLRNVPGPWYCALSGLPYKLYASKGVHLEWMQRLHETYGLVVRIAPGVVSVRDVDTAHAIYSTHKFLKGPFYSSFDVTGVPNIFSTRDPGVSKIRRKLTIPMFTGAAVEEMDEMIMSAGIRPLLRRLRKHAEAGDSVNLMQLFHYMTFDVVGDILFGRNFNLMEDDNGGDNAIAWLSGMCKIGIYASVGDMQAEAEYSFGPLANKWFMPKLAECERKLTNIAGDMIMQLFAGTDTTATCCTWTTYLLSITPHARHRLLQELKEAIPDVNTEITHSMVRDLPYLNAVINESFRLRPVAGGSSHRLIPKGGVVFCNTYIAENLWDEPMAYKPERWLIEDEERLGKMRRTLFPFSMGVRACIGRDLAWMELRVALASLFRYFEPEVLPGDDMTPIFNLVIGPRGKALTARLTQRTE